MEKILLPDNHRRSVSSSLYIVEKLLDEIAQALTHPDDGIMYKMEVDVDPRQNQHIIGYISEAKKLIHQLYLKYELNPQHTLLSRFIESRKSKIWEILSGTNARGMKGYGPFPAGYAETFDSDIEQLIQIIDNV